MHHNHQPQQQQQQQMKWKQPYGMKHNLAQSKFWIHIWWPQLQSAICLFDDYTFFFVRDKALFVNFTIMNPLTSIFFSLASFVFMCMHEM